MRGGGALSVREVTGKPIKFISSGEKPDSLEQFHPDRMAKRILIGMGDVISLIESAVKVQQEEQEAVEAERMARQLTLDDFITMNRAGSQDGGISKLISASRRETRPSAAVRWTRGRLTTWRSSSTP